MSYQPGPDPGHGSAVPSHLTGFTVDNGFSVIPPRRPGTATAASWLTFVLAGLAAAGSVAALVGAVDAPGRGAGVFEMLVDILRPLALLGTGVGFTVCAAGLRGGRDGARVTTYVMAGGVAFTAVPLLFDWSFATVTAPFGVGDFGVGILASTAALGLAATAVALLATRRADVWFQEQRGEKFIDAAALDDLKPRGPLVAAILLGVIAVTEAGFLSFLVFAISGSASYDAAFTVAFLFDEPLLITLSAAGTAILVPLGRDSARVVALGLSGMLLVNLVTAVLGSLSAPGSGIAAYIAYFELTLTQFQAVAAIAVIVCLGRGTVADWFHRRRARQPW